jgi:tRNA threonylcarbamoyladenosine biosynthesis protein TsaB
MVPLAEMALARGIVEDVAYYTPFYLKEFVPGKSKSLL